MTYMKQQWFTWQKPGYDWFIYIYTHINILNSIIIKCNDVRMIYNVWCSLTCKVCLKALNFHYLGWKNGLDLADLIYTIYICRSTYTISNGLTFWGDFFMTIIQHMSTVVYYYILYIIVQGSAVGLFITPSPQTHLSALLKSYRTNDVCVGYHWPKHHHAVHGCIMKFLMPDLNYHWADPYNFCCSVYLCKY